jgi:hypothetical protein
MENKSFRYKEWLCKWHEERQIYILFSPHAWRMERYQCSEWDSDTLCKGFIDRYEEGAA